MKTILVVSADEQLATMLRQELSVFGFRVETIVEPDHLFEKIREVDPYALVIDFILKDENAAALCHRIKSEEYTKDIHIIILSDSSQIEPFTTKFGGFSMVQKPVVLAELVENIMAASKEKTNTL
jgi:DNA-binding response OmpR family regulator